MYSNLATIANHSHHYFNPVETFFEYLVASYFKPIIALSICTRAS